MRDFINAFHMFFDEEIIYYQLMDSSQNTVYLFVTRNNRYIIKQYSFDAINDVDTLKERKEQLRISQIWNEHGIDCIQPLTDIFLCEKKYYIIYPYFEGETYDEGELSLEQIKILARVQAKIHKLNIETNLSSHIKRLDMKNSLLQSVIDEINSDVDTANNYLCVCHNDFKPLNMIWKDNKPYLVDFDAVKKNHPTFSLVESAYTFCHNGSYLNMTYYDAYISEYKLEYKGQLQDIDASINGSWNGKLQWLDYLIKNRPFDPGIYNLTNQILQYQKYKDTIKEILYR